MKTDGTKILVVDDEVGYRKVLNNALTERGFVVKTAASGEEALEELKKQEFPIVIVDMKLPGGIDGLELLQRVKGMYNSSILIMTAYGGIETAVEAMRRGHLIILQSRLTLMRSSSILTASSHSKRLLKKTSTCTQSWRRFMD